MRSEHKNTKHCYEKDGISPIIYILAFFQVVASGQISPHFRPQRYIKNSDLQVFDKDFFAIVIG